MNKIFFYMPFLYAFHTRLNSSKKIAAWILSYLIPSFMAYFLFLNDSSMELWWAIKFILCIATVYCSYEIGYIYNDSEVIKKEKYPTLRLNVGEIEFYEKNKIKIYSTRGLLLCFLFLLVFFTDRKLGIAVTAVSIFILTIYSVYNNIRNRWNIPLYSALVFLRYFGVLIFFCNLKEVLTLWLVYPLCVTIEFLSKPRFDYPLSTIINNLDFFRVVYYLILLTVFIIGYVLGFIDVDIIYLVIYLFLFRIFSYFFLSKYYR